MRGAGVFVPHFINVYVMPIWNVSPTDIFGSNVAAVPPPGGMKEPNIPNMLAIATNEAGLDSDQKINMTKLCTFDKRDFFNAIPAKHICFFFCDLFFKRCRRLLPSDVYGF